MPGLSAGIISSSCNLPPIRQFQGHEIRGITGTGHINAGIAGDIREIKPGRSGRVSSTY
ncbi:MAG: hypothetical protein NTV68_09605 [Methanomicrobiales archaeon]|nr:hypothetical protein [Methanomicrobiales archaeon]